MALFKTKVPPKKKGPDPESRPVLVNNNRFQMVMDSDWRDQTIYRFVGPEKQGVQHHINLTIDNDVEMDDVRKYARGCIRVLSEELQGYTELKQDSYSLDGDDKAYEVVYKWCPVDGRTIIQQNVYILSGQNAFTLMASFSEETWQTLGPQVDRILKSFKTNL